MISVTLVPHEEIINVWPKIRKYVVQIADGSGGRASVTDIYDQLANHKMLLWVAFEYEVEVGKVTFLAFICTSIKEYPDVRMLHMNYIGGERIDEWDDQMNEVLGNFAASQECAGVEGVGRIGWDRFGKKHGYKPRFVIMEKLFKVPEQLAHETKNIH